MPFIRCSAQVGALWLAGLSACAHAMIPGTTVRDTPENHAVYDVLVELREGIEQRDSTKLLALVSPSYFEDNGTADPRDDYGYIELKERLLSDTMSVAKEVFLAVELHEIVVAGDHAYADVRYASRTRLELPAGRLWDTHRDFNRIEMARENGLWRITSGL